MKKMLLMMASAMMLPCSAETILLDNPKEMNVTMKGDPESTWVVRRSRIVPAKPNTWYRATAEIKVALNPGTGRLLFKVRQIGKNDKSLVYSDIARLKPALLNYCPYSNVFLTNHNTEQLQVYYQLFKADGTASFRNLKLEEVSKAEAEKIRSAYKIPSAFFAPPVYAYEQERELPWGYRITTEFLAKDQIPARITIRFPELNEDAAETARVNIHANTKIQLKQPLKKGKYRIVMTALDASGKELAREERILRVIARPKKSARLPVKTVSIDPAGNTVINGNPVLLRGLYHVYSDSQVREVADAGFNTVIAWEPTPEKYLKMLDWMSKYDLYADCVIKRLPPEKLADLLAAIGKHPSIISFDPEDEPDIKGITPAKLMPRVNQIRKACPGRPLRISCSGPGSVGLYADCAEIICAHHYVIPFGGLPLQAKSTEQVVSAFPEPRKNSPQMTLQSWVHWHDITRKPQTPEQTRSIAYIALIKGVKGLWWYSFIDKGSWDVRSVPSIWTAFKGLNAELADLEEVILTGKRLPVRIETPDSGVLAAAWQLPEPPATVGNIAHNPVRTVIIAVNTMKTPVRARITGLTVRDGKLTELFADGETVRVQAGTAEFPLAPETTRVFEWKK